jgi:6-pyruvoyltetrahydropterin/6-carboxytetrahydropterin synthase
MDEHKLAQVRVIPAVGAEQFAKFVYEKLNEFIHEETNGRVRVAQVEFMEHGKNSALYKG